MTTTERPVAWHGDPALKAYAMARMRQHAEADRFIRGAYVAHGETTWRGCLHGCLTAEALAAEQGVPPIDVVTTDWHGETQRLWGIPRALGVLLDKLYEFSPDKPGDLAVSILDAIPVGADLAPVVDFLMLDLLADPDHGVARHTAEGTALRAAVERVAALYRRRLAGDNPPVDEWRACAARADYADACAYATTDACAYAASAARASAAYGYAAYASAARAAYGYADYASAARAAYGYADYAYASADYGGQWWAWWQRTVLTRLTQASAHHA